MWNFLHQFFFIDQKTKQMSHTKFWSQIGYGTMVYTFIYAVRNGTTIDVMIWALFGVVVIGNRTILQLMGRAADKEDKHID